MKSGNDTADTILHLGRALCRAEPGEKGRATGFLWIFRRLGPPKVLCFMLVPFECQLKGIHFEKTGKKGRVRFSGSRNPGSKTHPDLGGVEPNLRTSLTILGVPYLRHPPDGPTPGFCHGLGSSIGHRFLGRRKSSLSSVSSFLFGRLSWAQNRKNRMEQDILLDWGM